MKYKEDLQVKIFPGKELTKIIDFAETERNKDARFRNVWIIFDRDEVKNFDELINKANNLNMNVGWSNPCFEIWMSAYFGQMKNTCSSVQCCSDFKGLLISKTQKKNYSKSDKDIYEVLVRNGDEKKAIDLSKKDTIPSLRSIKNQVK